MSSYPDAQTSVLNLMRRTFGDLFNAYFDGRPDNIPKSAFPCIAVQYMTPVVTFGGVGTDDMVSPVVISVLINSQDYVEESAEVDTTMRKLKDIVQGRAADGGWLPNTVMGALRTNITLDNTIVNLDEMTVEYNQTPAEDDTWIKEATITITTNEIIVVPART